MEIKLYTCYIKCGFLSARRISMSENGISGHSCGYYSIGLMKEKVQIYTKVIFRHKGIHLPEKLMNVYF